MHSPTPATLSRSAADAARSGSPTTTLRRGTRWWLVAPALVAAALAAGELGGWPFLQWPVRQVVQRLGGVPATLDGRFRMRLLWRPMLQVEHLRIDNARPSPHPFLLEARGLDLGWRWGDVWRWRRGEVLLLQRLHAQHLQAYLARDAAGHANWQFGSAPPDAGDDAWQPPRIGSLRVHEGQVVVDDQPFETQLRIALQGGEGERAPAGDTGYRMAVQGRYRALPLDLALQSGGALPLLQEPEADAPALDVPLRVEGRAGAAWLRFDGSAGALLGERRLQGALLLRGPSLAQVAKPLGLTLPQTPPFELKAQLGHAAGVWHLRAERAAIGSSLLDGEFRLDTRRQPALLQGRLGGRRLALLDLGPAIGAPQGEGAKQRGRLLPQRQFDLPSLRGMDADVQLAIDELDFGTSALAPLLDLRTRLQLQRGVLQLQQLKAHVAGGSVRGATRLDPNAEPARWEVDLRFSNIDIAGWMAGLRPAGEGPAPRKPGEAGLKQQRRQARAAGEQPVQSYLTGTLNAAIKATGRGRSTAEILGSLDGRAQVMLREGTLSHLATEALGLDVAEGLGVLLRGDQPLPLRCGWFDLALQHGIVQPQQAVVDNADTEFRLSGHVNLRDESLALRIVARPKDVSPFTLRTPVTLQGSLASPQVSVEGERLAAKTLGAVVLGAAINPLLAWLPFVDLGVGHENDACSRRPPSAPQPTAAQAAR